MQEVVVDFLNGLFHSAPGPNKFPATELYAGNLCSEQVHAVFFVQGKTEYVISMKSEMHHSHCISDEMYSFVFVIMIMYNNNSVHDFISYCVN